MKSHLSSQQLDGILCGEPSQEAAQHLDNCTRCASEVASLQEVFGNLRLATTAAAEHHHRFVPPAGARKVPRMAWALAAIAVFASITTPIVLHHRQSVPVVAQENASSAGAGISDDALLTNVQNDLSASVPESMAPLSSTSTSSTATDSNQEQRKN